MDTRFEFRFIAIRHLVILFIYLSIFVDMDYYSLFIFCIQNQLLFYIYIDGKNPDLSVSQAQIRLGTCITILGFFEILCT